jgi:hypothetical protein
MIRSELSKRISLLTVVLLLLHVVLQSAGWWSVQMVTSADGSDCCGAEFCCCAEADTDVKICSCSISETPQDQEKSEILFCGIRTNDHENENHGTEVIMEWMDIKALVQSSQSILQPESIRILATLPDLYQEVLPDLSPPPPKC